MEVRGACLAISLILVASLLAGSGFAYTVSIESGDNSEAESFLLVKLCNPNGTPFTDSFFGTPTEEGGKIRLDNGEYVEIDNLRVTDPLQEYNLTIRLDRSLDQDLTIVLDGTEGTIASGDMSTTFHQVSGGIPFEFRMYAAAGLGTEGSITITMTATQYWPAA